MTASSLFLLRRFEKLRDAGSWPEHRPATRCAECPFLANVLSGRFRNVFLWSVEDYGEQISPSCVDGRNKGTLGFYSAIQRNPMSLA